MSLSFFFEIAMLMTSAIGCLVAGWIVWRARQQRDLQALSGFAIMMAIWCLGHSALFHDFSDLGVQLILANPLMPTFFLHFSTAFVKTGITSPTWLSLLYKRLPWVYVVSTSVVLLSWFVDAGGVSSSETMEVFFVFTDSGWFNLIYTVFIGVFAHAVLLFGWRKHKGNKKRSILVIFGVAAWGLTLATSFVFPSFGINWFPYPMLLLPSYLLLLVYAVLRYKILSVNAFANRALLWLAMMIVVLCVMALVSVVSGRLGLQALANVPSWQLWLYSMVILLVGTFTYSPLNRLVARLVYPGTELSESALESWSNLLKESTDWHELVNTGEGILGQQLGQKVIVTINADDVFSEQEKDNFDSFCDNNVPEMWVYKTSSGWLFVLHGWEEASPGQRLTAEVFGSLFSTQCGLLEQSLVLAETERKRLGERHLVELGGLSVAMAHELRNPLNIISIAAHSTTPETKRHIQTQLTRADRLIQDMLIYSGKLTIQKNTLVVAPLIHAVVQQMDMKGIDCTINVDSMLKIEVDTHRFQQVIVNLLDNAVAFLRNENDSRLLVEALLSEDDQAMMLRVHNNGPALNKDLTDETLFRPFVTRRSGGSGLGLAIVKRIMDAHKGSIHHRTDLGWPVTFELTFPHIQQL
ncbi:ATP-binding protein [Marinomonas sp. 2405UD68-3]|uniref:ATP-binding protein n=1 Tax=Marinomonas sp. 2405UD68-3 TaxID=3391835 RepID=UPI0039C919F2